MSSAHGEKVGLPTGIRSDQETAGSDSARVFPAPLGRAPASRRAGSALPPGPRGRILQLFRYFRDPYRFFASCEGKYGPIFTLPFFGAKNPIVTFGHQEGLRAVFTADADHFEVAHPEAFEPIVGVGSLLGLNGYSHRRERKL